MVVSQVFLISNQGFAQEIYNDSCAKCHDSGRVGAPVRGSSQLQKRLELRGVAGLYGSVLHGRARMPKRGGCFSCTDVQLKQALKTMLEDI